MDVDTKTTLQNVKQTLEMLLEDVHMSEKHRWITQWTLDQVVKTLAEIDKPGQPDDKQ